MISRATIGPSARPPLMVAVALVLAASVVGDAAAGSFAQRGSWPLYVAALAGAAGTGAILLPSRVARPWIRDVVILFAAAVTSASSLVLYGSPLYDGSLFSFGIVLCGLVVLLGAWLPGVVIGLSLVALHASVVLVRDPGASWAQALDLYALTVLAAAVGWNAFARALAKKEVDFRQRSRDALHNQRERERDLARLRMGNALAGSGALQMLSRVVVADTIDDGLRLNARVAEASLRDRIRVPGLQHPLLSPEITKARLREVEIVLLAAAGSPAAAAPHAGGLSNALAERLTEIIRGLEPGERVTLRQIHSKSTDGFVSVALRHRDGSGAMQVLEATGELARPR